MEREASSEALPGASASSRTDAKGDGAGRAHALLDVVHDAFDALAPMLAKLLADRRVSGESAMHVVVMDPAADPRTATFEGAILAERSFGDTARWKADYPWYARAKTRLAWRERMSLRTLFAEHAERLQADDIRVEGAVCEGPWVVGASGAQAWYDHAIATTTIALIEAGIAQARQREAA
jgi:hypothetical protein